LNKIERITSVNNDLVKETVKLHQRKRRDESGRFLLEGFKVIEEAYRAGIEIETVFVLTDKALEYDFAKVVLTTEAVLKKISTTNSAPEAVAVGVQRRYDKSVLKDAKKVVLLENIKDLGNLGTILRTCAAFGVDAAALYGESADIYNPKCVRASVGNLWKIPVVSLEELSMFKDFERIATLPRAKTELKDFTVKEPYLLMFGSEAGGLSQELIDFGTRQVRIEMSGDVESLNLGVACGIILHQLNCMYSIDK
jgi:TrmH family RNA methyltransferase